MPIPILNEQILLVIGDYPATSPPANHQNTPPTNEKNIGVLLNGQKNPLEYTLLENGAWKQPGSVLNSNSPQSVNLQSDKASFTGEIKGLHTESVKNQGCQTDGSNVGVINISGVLSDHKGRGYDMAINLNWSFTKKDDHK